MASKSTIDIKITGDASRLNRVLGDTQSRLSRFGAGLAGVGRKAGIAFAGMGTAAVIAAPKILEAGVELESLARKAETVFEDSLGGVRRWADENAAAMGLTSSQLVGLAASTADLLKPMGLSAKAAADMATETNDLAGALSAWTGGQRDAAEVSEILTKAYLGEREGLKSLGISITEADVKTRLAAKGQEELTGAQLQQAKALATQELIMEKSTDAQQAWADGSMDGVKAQNEARASIERVKESLVVALAPAIQAMLPLVEKFATWLGEHLPAAVEAVKTWFEKNWPLIQAAAEKVVSWFKEDAMPVIETVAAALVAAFLNVKAKVEEYWPRVQEVASAVVAWFKDSAMPVIKSVSDAVVAAFLVVKTKVEEYWPAIRKTITDVVDAIKIIVETVIGAVQVFWDNFGSHIMATTAAAWEVIRSTIKIAIDLVRGIITTVTALIKGDWSEVWNGIKTIVSAVWEGIKTLINAAIEVVKISIGAALTAISLAWNATWSAIATFVSDVWNGIKSTVAGAIEAVVGFISDLASKIAGAVSGTFNAVSEEIQPIIDLIGKIVGAVDRAISALSKLNPANWGPGKIVVPPEIVASQGGNNAGRASLTSAQLTATELQAPLLRGTSTAATAAGAAPVSLAGLFDGANLYGNSLPDELMDHIVTRVSMSLQAVAL